MKYHNAKAISPVIKAYIVSYTGSCRVQLLDCYLKMAAKIPAISWISATLPTNKPVIISLKNTMNKIIPSTTIVLIF